MKKRIAAGTLDMISAMICCFFVYEGVDEFIDFRSMLIQLNTDFGLWDTLIMGNFQYQIIVPLVASIGSVLGGFFTFQIKRWWLALTGSIFTLVFPTFCIIADIAYYPEWLNILILGALIIGITAIVLTVISKREFIERSQSTTTG